ncbi:hypothetical protein HK100_011975 [Physocladia obscura]|uniref:TIR domain-containing protein n=1 Tax=Physocladia obscura TaxID=109957 RepID=A0AAD5XHY4_9FUNG|nr:hypothetical protein HK100_011975 [Physocladia obscura]
MSISWAQKDRVERLATFLRQYFTVWIDNERMIGDINESMASAIRSSKVIIACLSREYYGSRNCKHEIMFADKQAKAIVWLHFDNAKCPDWCEIIANKDLYYTVTSLADLQSKLPKIQEAIENLIGHSSAAKTPTVVGIKRADPPRIRSRLPELEKLGLRPVRVDEIIEEKRVALLKGTRKQLLDEITVWCANTNSKCIFWLKGVAGSGKSVIAANVMEMLRVSNKKACAFFCKHSVQDQSDPRKLIQTIAYQLAQLIPSAQQMIQEEIEENEHLLGSSLLLLATKLIIQPLQQYHDSQIFIVVDALDECRNRAEVAKIFNLIVDSFVSTKIKLFFTSRPEQDISREIPAEGREIILSENYNLEDVLLYSHNRMAKLVKSLSTLSEFPTHKNLALRMAENAAGLFIWIKLAYDELEDVDDVEEAILNLLKVKGINELYTQIFKSACDGLDNVRLATASKVIGFIAAVKYPLSSNTLAALLGMKPASVQFYVARFRSIFVTNPNGTIKFMHKSVEDYIADPSQNTVLSISLTEIENEITRLCFTIRSNINWKPLNTGKKIFLSELEVYAFMHISSSSQANTKLSEDVEENGYIPAFYNPEIAQSIVYNPENEIETSLTVRTKGTSSQTITSDYTEFFPRFGTKFQPTNSTLFLQHGLENNIPRVLTGVQDNWISSLKSLRYASDNICSVAVSRNSNYTIPGGGVVVESTNLLSNFTTNDDARASWIVGGNSIANFQENGVLSVASSTDGLHLVSANPFGAVKLWEIFRETLMAMLNDHTGKALSVTFSTDANFITVKLWNASNHELVAKFTIEFNQT